MNVDYWASRILKAGVETIRSTSIFPAGASQGNAIAS